MDTTKHVIETVTFKLNTGVSREEFAQAAIAMNAFIEAQPGFIARRLSCSENGEWIEHIEWMDMKTAKDAAALVGSAEVNKPALAAIDGSTVTIHHTELEVALN